MSTAPAPGNVHQRINASTGVTEWRAHEIRTPCAPSSFEITDHFLDSYCRLISTTNSAVDHLRPSVCSNVQVSIVLYRDWIMTGSCRCRECVNNSERRVPIVVLAPPGGAAIGTTKRLSLTVDR